MLFNSYIFIFLFLPAAVATFHLLERRGHRRAAIGSLVFASLFFYGWWNPAYLALIAGSIVFNYAVGTIVTSANLRARKGMTAVGIAGNLALLAYFKYANFFVDTTNDIAGTAFHLQRIALPLAISFFTFQQIAYLVDLYRKEVEQGSFLHYCLFVTFFPQLIAGPIVHHKELIPQFAQSTFPKPRQEMLAIGTTIFALGLFKKVVLADGIAFYATPVFEAAEGGVAVSFCEAWLGTLAYTLQIYFDFSGYSDMAIGLGWFFGIRLPINFDSPYKATSVIDFWRRWHITLSRFLRDYLYFPLGGNRKGRFRRHVNLMTTMLLGGLWHGAGWTFVCWGGLHGLYLICNHGWRATAPLFGIAPDRQASTTGRIACRALTFFAVVIGWVLFRAESIESATQILSSMFGAHGLPSGLHWNELFPNDLASWHRGAVWLSFLLSLVWLAPNTAQLMSRHKPTLSPPNPETADRWVPKHGFTFGWAAFTAMLLTASMIFLSRTGEFLYFNF